MTSEERREVKKRISQLRAYGLTFEQIANRVGITKSYVWFLYNDYDISTYWPSARTRRSSGEIRP